MFGVQITFAWPARVAEHRATDALYSLLGAWLSSGQVLDSDAPLTVSARRAYLFAALPERDALAAKHQNAWVRSARARISALGIRTTVRFFGQAADSADPCSCGAHAGYVLYTTFIDIQSPLRCYSCFGTVPLYRVPPPGHDYSGYREWHANWRACDAFQMGCGVGERFGARQISAVDSPLSRHGLRLCAYLREATGHPAYYYLYRDSKLNDAFELARRCPKCGSAWLRTAALHGYFDFECRACQLLSNLPPHVSLT